MKWWYAMYFLCVWTFTLYLDVHDLIYVKIYMTSVLLFLVDILQQADTTLLGLSPQDALKTPYVASMGVYVFKTEILLNFLRWRYPTSNDFGSEIIPAAVREHKVLVR